jgi:hypothetical protein
MLGFGRFVEGLHGLVPDLTHGALTPMKNMKMIFLIANLGLVLFAPLSVDCRQAFAHAAAAIARHLLDGRQLAEFLGPFRPVPTRSQASP